MKSWKIIIYYSSSDSLDINFMLFCQYCDGVKSCLPLPKQQMSFDFSSLNASLIPPPSFCLFSLPYSLVPVNLIQAVHPSHSCNQYLEMRGLPSIITPVRVLGDRQVHLPQDFALIFQISIWNLNLDRAAWPWVLFQSSSHKPSNFPLLSGLQFPFQFSLQQWK